MRRACDRTGRGDAEVASTNERGRARDDLIIIDHTEVDDSLRGKGGGARLFKGMVAWARDTRTQIMSTCPFANAMFERDPSSRDVLA